MVLGRVITKSKNLKTLDFIEKFEEYTEDKSVPTLIIGKQRAKDALGTDFSVFERVVDENLRWTFLKTEKRNEFEADLESFNQEMISRIKDRCHYLPINLFSTRLSIIKRLIDYFKNEITKYVYITDKQIYVFSLSGQKNQNIGSVLGISLDEIEYLGISKVKILNRLRSMSNCAIIEDDNFLSYTFKKSFGNYNLYLPYLYFLKNQ